jgi:hypothetical protein
MDIRHAITALVLLLAMSLDGGLRPPAHALPQGRAWIGVDTLVVSGFDYMAAPLLEWDDQGRLIMVGGAHSSSGAGDKRGLVWRDSAWSEIWALGRSVGFTSPVVSSTDNRFLIWREVTLASHFIFSRLTGHGPAEPETIATIGTGTNLYAAAASRLRRWAIAPDFKDLRAFVGETGGAWREIETGRIAGSGSAVAPLTDTTALVVWPELSGMYWGTLGDSALTLLGQIPTQLRQGVPMLRRRPSGGYWLSWGTFDPALSMAVYEDGTWSPRFLIPCNYSQPVPHITMNSEMSRDDGEYPVVAWTAQRSGRTAICVCIPTDSGFTTAEELAFAPDGLLPTVARDRNGDVWVAWWKFFDGIFWTHTYVTATARDVRLAGAGTARSVRWTLSESAPETWWAVLRAQNDGDFEEVARVRAASDRHMTWEDPSPPAGVLRYRIRRESVDTRDEWVSEEVRWPARSRRPVLTLASANPLAAEAEFEVLDAAEGPLTLRIYDVMGRIAARGDTSAGTALVQRMRIALGAASGTRAGVYFAVAEDAAGAISAPVKLVVLR